MVCETLSQGGPNRNPPEFTCSKTAVKTLKQCVKYFQS